MMEVMMEVTLNHQTTIFFYTINDLRLHQSTTVNQYCKVQSHLVLPALTPVLFPQSTVGTFNCYTAITHLSSAIPSGRTFGK